MRGVSGRRCEWRVLVRGVGVVRVVKVVSVVRVVRVVSGEW